MHRILLALITLSCLPLVARAGWDVEFELHNEFETADNNKSDLLADRGNPLVPSWNMKGVEEYVAAPLNYCRTPPPARPKPIEHSDILQVMKGSWPLTPQTDKRPIVNSDLDAITEALWPSTRSYLQRVDDDAFGG